MKKIESFNVKFSKKSRKMAHFQQIFRVNRSTGDVNTKTQIFDADKEPKMNEFVPNSYRNFLTRLPTPANQRSANPTNHYLDTIVQVGNAFLPPSQQSDR